MESTDRHPHHRRESAAWREAGLRYYAYNFHLREKFGHRVQRVSIDAGFTCPNVDGTVTTGGCNFCDNRSFSPSRRQPKLAITAQIDEGIRRLKRRYDCNHFMAYFQPATNTYAPVERLRKLYDEALLHPQVVAMAIGTRPDCVPDDVIELLNEFAERTYLTVEYGMQTMHDRSLQWMNRGDSHASFVDAMQRSQNRGFEICAHVIIGIPGESHADIMATADELTRHGVDAVKIHNLYAVKKTALGDEYQRGDIKLMERDEYVETVVDFLQRMPPNVIIERISGEAPGDYFLGPSWCLDKPAVKRAIDDEFARRGTFQGSDLSTVT